MRSCWRLRPTETRTEARELHCLVAACFGAQLRLRTAREPGRRRGGARRCAGNLARGRAAPACVFALARLRKAVRAGRGDLRAVGSGLQIIRERPSRSAHPRALPIRAAPLRTCEANPYQLERLRPLVQRIGSSSLIAVRRRSPRGLHPAPPAEPSGSPPACGVTPRRAARGGMGDELSARGTRACLQSPDRVRWWRSKQLEALRFEQVRARQLHGTAGRLLVPGLDRSAPFVSVFIRGLKWSGKSGSNRRHSAWEAAGTRGCTLTDRSDLGRFGQIKCVRITSRILRGEPVVAAFSRLKHAE
jgi:hypothetical protein